MIRVTGLPFNTGGSNLIALVASIAPSTSFSEVVANGKMNPIVPSYFISTANRMRPDLSFPFALSLKTAYGLLTSLNFLS